MKNTKPLWFRVRGSGKPGDFFQADIPGAHGPYTAEMPVDDNPDSETYGRYPYSICRVVFSVDEDYARYGPAAIEPTQAERAWVAACAGDNALVDELKTTLTKTQREHLDAHTAWRALPVEARSSKHRASTLRRKDAADRDCGGGARRRGRPARTGGCAGKTQRE